MADMNEKAKRSFPRTISPELHEAWQTLWRPGDNKWASEKLLYSLPVICHAIKHGYVATPELPDLISKLLTDRIAAEKETSIRLLEGYRELIAIKANEKKEAKKVAKLSQLHKK